MVSFVTKLLASVPRMQRSRLLRQSVVVSGNVVNAAEERQPNSRADQPWIGVSQVLSAALAVLVLLQAAFAGQFLYTSPGMRTAHRVVGEGLGVVGMGLLAAAAMAWRANRERRRLLGTAVWMIVILIAETGLGFVGRSTPDAAALHIPLGVVAFGVAVYAFLLSRLTEPSTTAPRR